MPLDKSNLNLISTPICQIQLPYLILLMVQNSCTSCVVYPIMYKILYIPGGAGFLPLTVSTDFRSFQSHHIHSFPGLTPLPLLTVEVEAAPPRSVCSLEPGLLAEKTFEEVVPFKLSSQQKKLVLSIIMVVY